MGVVVGVCGTMTDPDCCDENESVRESRLSATISGLARPFTTVPFFAVAFESEVNGASCAENPSEPRTNFGETERICSAVEIVPGVGGRACSSAPTAGSS